VRRALVLASGNRHKLEELRLALPDWAVELVPDGEPPPEDGATFEDNARIKARWGRRHASSARTRGSKLQRSAVRPAS
jgi:inosine/xanthosine triphosphate pyrophosphatase family protein